MTDEGVEFVATKWPAGPTYAQWVGAEGSEAWVLYKLRSANWYIDRLDEVGKLLGFGRYVGVEMALDGALGSLCGAFDAAVGGIIGAVEQYLEAGPEAEELGLVRIDAHQYSWGKCKKRLDLVAGVLTQSRVSALCIEIDDALDCREDHPLGWLTELRRLRNAAIHNDTLGRHIDVLVADDQQTTWQVTVGAAQSDGVFKRQGRGEHPVEYLRSAHAQLGELLKTMLSVIDHLCPNGIPTTRDVQNATIKAKTAQAFIDAPQGKVTAESSTDADGP